MTAPIFYIPQAQPLSDVGTVQPGCYLQFYRSETTDLEDIYADGDLDTPLDNPLTSNDAGRFPAIYLDPRVPYRVQLYSALDVLLFDIDPYFPVSGRFVGETVLYGGDLDDVPAGWHVCDGTNGTLDMRDFFPVGASNSKAVGSTGGSTGLTGNTGSAGIHDHGGTVSDESLTLAQLAAHGHGIYAATVGSSDVVEGFLTPGQNVAIAGDKDQTHAVIDDNSAGTQLVDDAGDGDPHSHVIAEDGEHTHTIEGEIDPPYVAWYFLTFTGVP